MLASTIAYTLMILALGVALIVEGPTLVTPIAVILAPRFGSTQTVQVQPGSNASSTLNLNSGDRFISEMVIQGGNASLMIKSPQGITKNYTSLGQEFTLDYKAPISGAYSIVFTSESKIPTFVLEKTVTIRSILGMETTTVVGALILIPPVLVIFSRLGYVQVFRRSTKLEKPEKIKHIIPDGQSIIVSAPACNEYDSMVISFLGDSLKEGKSVFYVSLRSTRIEDFARKYPGHVHALIGDLRARERIPDTTALETFSGLTDLTGLDITISQLLAKVDVGHGAVAYLDIVSDVLLSHNLPIARRWLMQTLGKLKGKGLTVVGGVNPTMVPLEKVQGATDVFDGHLEMIESIEGQQTRRYLQWTRRPQAYRK